MAEKAFGDAPYSIVKTCIPYHEVTETMRVVVDRGIQSIVVPSEKLQKLLHPEILDTSIKYRNN